MPKTCACCGCTNRSNKTKNVSFHKFPLDDPTLLKRWLNNIRRADFKPTSNHSVCSDHFVKEDYVRGIHARDDQDATHHLLLQSAVPTVFPAHPARTQKQCPSRKPLKKRPLPDDAVLQPPEKRPSLDLSLEHGYSKPSDHLKKELEETIEHGYSKPSDHLEKELKETKQKLQDAQKELKGLKQKLRRRDDTISKLLKAARDQDIITQGQLDLLHLNFGEKTFSVIENELQVQGRDVDGLRYSDRLKQFAVTLHFYSAQAYDVLRQYLHLPNPATVCNWRSSINYEPGFLTDVIDQLEQMVKKNPRMQHCILMLNAMVLKKEVKYDPKSRRYAGFIDCGLFQPSCSDSLATEALVFMVVSLTGHFKIPVAYYLADHLSGDIQAGIIKQLIFALTNAGLKVHGVIADGTYANQTTAVKLGCVLIPGSIQSYFTHPVHASERVHFMFDAYHLLKLVQNCLATYGTVIHNGNGISWHYIDKLHGIQQTDNLTLANKLTDKHILWEQHKMKVQLPVQPLSSSVADAIDFLREDLKMPQFAGSEKTTEFIRTIDRLFDLMNSKTLRAKGFKHPMNRSNLSIRRTWLEDTKKYIENLTDDSGQRLIMGRRKAAWIGFLVTIDSVLSVCNNLLNNAEPFPYVCTFKMSQDHLEIFFSRLRRRGGWNNNPNCLQFKWALRAILQKNSIAPSTNGNVTMEEPLNELFKQAAPASVHHENQNMKQFAKLLSEPSEFHDNILRYMAGYVTKHIIQDCKCTHCCMALHRNASWDRTYNTTTTVSDSNLLTVRKDRGGLVKPRDDVFTVVKTTNKILRRSLAHNNRSTDMSRDVLRKVQLEVLEATKSVVFLDLADHFQEQNLLEEDDHGNQLIKAISKLFIQTILHHYGRLHTDRDVNKNQASKRHQLTKAILFWGQ